MGNCLRNKIKRWKWLLFCRSHLMAGQPSIMTGWSVVLQTPLRSSGHVPVCCVTWDRRQPFSFPWRSRLSDSLPRDRLQSEAGAGVRVVPGHGDPLALLRQDGRAQPSWSWCSGVIMGLKSLHGIKRFGWVGTLPGKPACASPVGMWAQSRCFFQLLPCPALLLPLLHKLSGLVQKVFLKLLQPLQRNPCAPW